MAVGSSRAGREKQRSDNQDWRSFRARLVALEHAGAVFASDTVRGPDHLHRGAGTLWPSAPPLQRPNRSGRKPHANRHSRQWAHSLSAPEAGCLLVAREGVTDFFSRTVVLVADHDEVEGTVGFVLNKPSPLKFSQVQFNGSCGQEICPEMSNQTIHLGGPVHTQTMTVVHGYSGLTGASQIIEGVYYGGLNSALQLVRSGMADPEEFMLVLGMTGWAPQQLSREIAEGTWCVAATSTNLIVPSPSSDLNREGLWAKIGSMMGTFVAESQ